MNDWKLDKKRLGTNPPYQYWFRKQQNCKSAFAGFYRLMLKFTEFFFCVEIGAKCKIGPGLYIAHPFNITINGNAQIGRNCNIHKGLTIGQENRGKRKGCPTIGNCVWIGVNSTIVGGITIGDDVLIAPNSYVNTDIPSHSVVYGNPCVIVPRTNATEGYINNKV